LARDLGCGVVAGTALLDHPRTHWEAWPHTGCLFHTAWSFGPDGEPHDVLRDGEPGWDLLSDIEVDGSRSGASGVLQTHLAPIAVDWGQGAPEEGVIAWRPRADASPSRSDETGGESRRPYVVSSLQGALGQELQDHTVIHVPGFTATQARPPQEAVASGLGWCAVETRS